MTDLDVAIIGGGCAGTYSAWRLQQEIGADNSIGLFEYSDRIGGRLYSVTVPGVPSLKAELGGMRYIQESHKMVADLVEHLKLADPRLPHGRARSGRRQLQPLLPARPPSQAARARRSGQGPLQSRLVGARPRADQPPDPGDGQHLSRHGQSQPVRPDEIEGVRPAAVEIRLLEPDVPGPLQRGLSVHEGQPAATTPTSPTPTPSPSSPPPNMATTPSS